MTESLQAQRKAEHLSLAEKLYPSSHRENSFAQVRLLAPALPETAVAEVDLTTPLGPLTLERPYFIEAMTGGSRQATKVNRQLARLAKRHRLAMATGSMSIIFKDPEAAASFTAIREENPDGLVFANLGAGANLAQAKQAVDLIGADALEIHLNALQETVMAEGDRAFYWRENLAAIIADLDVPVIVKEVGAGMRAESIAALAQLGAQLVTVAGRGGTNFAAIENRRNRKEDLTFLEDFGLTTPESLLEARLLATDQRPTILANGGITSPLDLVKALALGARAGGIAGAFLHRLITGGEAGLDAELTRWEEQLPRLLALLGCRRPADLTRVPVVLNAALASYQAQRRDQLNAKMG